jgi:hypothetical protein
MITTESIDDSAPITFVVAGQRVEGGWQAGTTRSAEPGAARSLPGQPKASIRLGVLRGPGSTQSVIAVPGEDIVALHIAGGPVLLLHPTSARDLMLAQAGAAVTRGAATGEIHVGPQLRWKGLEGAAGPGVTRGLLGDVVLAAFEVLTGFAKDKVIGKAADWAASAVVQKVDAQVEPGLHALAPEALPKLKAGGRRVARVPEDVAAAGPLLVFIHGTFVETSSTFGKLWALHPQRVRQLFGHYGGRVYALEHETLGKSPVANARLLVDALPDGARLHLVTHSRGGLVAEVLARAAHEAANAKGTLGASQLPQFAAPEYKAQRQELIDLIAAMKGRGIQVERVLRVACPARGTLLAAKRLDAYLSVLKWGIEKTGVPLAGEFMDFLTEVARRRAEPEMIPGLAAMIPDTPLLQWLNAAPEPIAGDLRVVAGDLEGDSVGSWVKTLLTDAYYWTDNDIVVQTRSMYAGAPRKGGASFLLDQGGKTTHFAYFVNPRTVEAVVDGLLADKPPAGFAPIGPLSWAGHDAGGLRGSDASPPDPAKPCVFVLPGILGSNLAQAGDRIWLSLRLVGGLDRLRYAPGGADGVKEDGPISLVYDKLIEHLATSHEVRPFGFDWRRPIEEEAARLADAIDEALKARETTGTPVRLLAHSMGGLVARTVQIVRPQTWQRMMNHADARLVMLGTPNAGSYAPMQVLSGDDTFGNALAAFGSPLSDREARRIMATMPGFLQLQAGLLDPTLKLDDAAEWARIAKADYERVQEKNWWHRHAGESMEAAYHWGLPPQEVLDQACALRRQLDVQRARDLPAFANQLLLVVGAAKATPVGYSETASEGFVYLDAADGDGRVPRESALLPGVKTWRLDCEHGSLPSAQGAFDAFVELLDKGDTRRLEPLAVLRAAEAVAPPAISRSRPARGLGRGRRGGHGAKPALGAASVFSVAEPTAAVAPTSGGALAVRLLNGNLKFLAEPLLIGHYRGPELFGSEKVVNGLLGQRLQQALDAGLYPGELGTHQVFVNTSRSTENPWAIARPKAVVVVGLGNDGELTERTLLDTVRQAVLAWSFRAAETDSDGQAGVMHEIAATLMGSGGLGVNAATAARAIARGVSEANAQIAALNAIDESDGEGRRKADRSWPIVGRLTIVEIYLDRANEAWQALRTLAEAHPEAYSTPAALEFGVGPLRRAMDGNYRSTDHDLITAVGRDDGVVEYVLHNRRARTEVRAQRTQLRLVQDLVRKAATARGDNPTLGRVLFQLLVPVELEPFLGGVERMVLDLDARTAPIPWELLDTGSGARGGDPRPWALRSRLLRRLRVPTPMTPRRDAELEHDVLVIAEPLLDEGSNYPPLPGAREEGTVVMEALCASGVLGAERVLALTERPDATAVISALLDRPWRIVHIAGHGEAPKDSPTKVSRGVVLDGDHFLGPDEIRAMRVIPELVFVNCCHLAGWREGQTLATFDPAGFAASVAQQLIEIGVRCVVACGWAVEDGPAHEFARGFYGALVAQQTFLEAVGAGREACWAANPMGKSWAAYQCYGDPSWRFRAARAVVSDAGAFGSPEDLVLELETIVTECRYMGANTERQRKRLERLESGHAERWGAIGAVAEAFGLAWEAADSRPKAIDWLRRAVAAPDGSARVRAEEKYQNLQARQAFSDAVRRAGTRASARARDAALQALAGMEALVERSPTLERLSLLGSACKRLALIDRAAGDAAGERQHLGASLAAYRRAAERSATEGDGEYFYPGLNCLALHIVLGLGERKARGSAPADEVAQWWERSTASLQARSQRSPDFWSQVGLVEIELYRAIDARRLAPSKVALQAAWAELHARLDHPGWWGSVADQGDLVLSAYRQGAPAAAERAAALALWQQLLGYSGLDDAAIAARTGTVKSGSRGRVR